MVNWPLSAPDFQLTETGQFNWQPVLNVDTVFQPLLLDEGSLAFSSVTVDTGFIQVDKELSVALD